MIAMSQARQAQARALSVMVRRNPPKLRLTTGMRCHAIAMARGDKR